jgi:hypothetical protein
MNPSIAPITSPKETLFIFYSDFSRVCSQVMPQVQYVSPHIQTVLINIDNPATREFVLKQNKIQKVPSALLVNNQFKTADFYEGIDFFNLLTRTIEMIQAQQVKSLQATPVESIVIEPSEHKIKKKKQVRMQEPVEEDTEDMLAAAGMKQDETRFTTDMSSTMMSRATPSRIKKGEGHEGMKQSSLSFQGDTAPVSADPRATVLDDDDNEYDSQPQGMTPEEIGAGGSENKARTEKSKSIRAAAEAMMTARGEIEFN